MGFYRGPNIVKNGLVLWLDAANPRSYPGSGTTWTDMSGNNNSGTLTNGPTYSAANNGSIVFDGTNDYVNCGSSSAYNPTSAITLGCWVYFNRLNIREIFIGKGNGAIASSNQYWIEKQSNNTILLLISVIGGSSEYGLTLSDFNIQNNQWYYISLTYNKQTFIGYVNGVQNTTTISVSFNLNTTSNNLAIGRLGDLAGRYLSGRISNVQLYNRALSASEVQQNYDALKSRYLNQY